MRTTINLDDHVLEQLKARAARTGLSVSRLIEDAVRLMLAQSSSATPEFKLVTFGSGGSFTRHNVDKAWRLLEQDDIERFAH